MAKFLGIAHLRAREALMRHTLCLAIFAFTCATLGAHEIGTTRVSVVIHEARTYDVEVITDASALGEKLAGSPPAALSKRVKIAFDGVDVTPAISYSAGGRLATLHFMGTVPAGARSFTWAYGWTFASYALSIAADGSAAPATQWLEGGETSAPFQLAVALSPVSRWRTLWRYLALGFTHILPNGLDHMLFVLGIYLLSGRARSVLLQVSAFTVAHSITLGLSLYGVVAVSSRIVEPMIAVSIAYVAIENIFMAELKYRRVALVFGFGLLHGMGFAGALKDLALQRSEFVTALMAFNIGVEAGQLAVIATAFTLIGWHCANRTWYRPRIVVPASAMIACVAIYWTIERL
jgi:hydrogenase/urease accessory protein HupE